MTAITVADLRKYVAFTAAWASFTGWTWDDKVAEYANKIASNDAFADLVVKAINFVITRKIPTFSAAELPAELQGYESQIQGCCEGFKAAA